MATGPWRDRKRIFKCEYYSSAGQEPDIWRRRQRTDRRGFRGILPSLRRAWNHRQAGLPKHQQMEQKQSSDKVLKFLRKEKLYLEIRKSVGRESNPKFKEEVSYGRNLRERKSSLVSIMFTSFAIEKNNTKRLLACYLSKENAKNINASF